MLFWPLPAVKAMSFQIQCPNCGIRDADEFRYGGECRNRPPSFADDRIWADYVFGRDNLAGEQPEWWYHRLGCRRWLVAVRNLTTNVVRQTAWRIEDLQEPAS